LPEAQAAAVRGALGLSEGEAGGRFLVGLAVLTLLSELAARRPVLCLVDDAHWLDDASADVLLFAARRLHAEGVAFLFAAREELSPAPLGREAATGLLAERFPGLPRDVRDRVVAEAEGNPLALVELPGGLTDEQRAGRAAAPAAFPVRRRVLESLGARIDRLP